MGTFEVLNALKMPLTCMRHLKPDRLIVVHSLDADICSHIISDKHWLSENVLCLLSNAIKYSDNGTVDLRISLGNNCDPNTGEPSLIPMVLVSVEDSGIGILKDKRNDLFQPFMQVQRSSGGTGLGLYSLSKRCIIVTIIVIVVIKIKKLMTDRKSLTFPFDYFNYL
jgi:signal transduction histidine kinase